MQKEFETAEEAKRESGETAPVEPQAELTEAEQAKAEADAKQRAERMRAGVS